MKLLCTDLDRTLIPNGEQPESPLARPLLWQLLARHDIQLAYVSGRDLNRVLGAIDEHRLRWPDVIVADVGTSIYVPDHNGWKIHEGWAEQIGMDWNGMDTEGIRKCLAGFGELEDQESDRQTRFKRSYYLPIDADVADLSQRLEGQLQSYGINASLVFSDDPEKGVKLLDVLPRQATKYESVVHVQQMIGVSDRSTLFSGDSGNDVAALASAIPSVTVANADHETREAVRRLAAQNHTLERCYQARGGLRLADGTELNGNYASGIVEGMAHFHPVLANELRSGQWLDELSKRI